MNTLKSFLKIINFKTLVISLIAIASTYFSVTYKVFADFPMNLMGIAVVFPIVFSIGGAYKRREVALSQYAGLKAHARSLYLVSRDWVGDDGGNNGERDALVGILKDIMIGTREMFHAPRAETLKKEQRIYHDFSELSKFVVGMEKRGLSGSGVSRSTQFLSKLMISFENMKHIFQYRTPVSLRAYSKIFIVLLPIIYGPHFAFISQEFTTVLNLTYIMPVLFAVILVSLDNIQDHLENPFDFIGSDDVFINAEKFVESLGE